MSSSGPQGPSADSAPTAGPSTAVVVVGISLVAVVGLVASVLLGVAVGRTSAARDLLGGEVVLADVGEPAGQACDDVLDDPGRGISTHVGPGTSRPETRVEYETVPPSTGPHLASPVFPADSFYAVGSAPPVEGLVHNLEHGYTVLWYDTDLDVDRVADLQTVATLAREMPEAAGKFIVVPWDDSHGELPDDRPVALSHWTAAEGGARQLCADVSGEAVEAFVTAFPAADSPEPNAP